MAMGHSREAPHPRPGASARGKEGGGCRSSTPHLPLLRCAFAQPIYDIILLMILQYVFKNINPLILFYFNFSYLEFCIIINQNRTSYVSFQGWNLTRLFEWNIKVAYELKINHLDSLWSFFSEFMIFQCVFVNLWFYLNFYLELFIITK